MDLIVGVMHRAIPRPVGRRLTQLIVGLIAYGVSDALLLLSRLGLDPWDVLQQGLSRRFGLGVGTWAILVGLGVLVLWIPLRQRPAFGTVANVLVVGSTIDVVMALTPSPRGLAIRIALMIAGVVLNAAATAGYIGAGLGPGPRDGLMTGLAARGHPLRRVRAAIELSVLACGWALGGTVGVGTVVYALAIGPLIHAALPVFAIRPGRRDPGTPCGLPRRRAGRSR